MAQLPTQRHDSVARADRVAGPVMWWATATLLLVIGAAVEDVRTAPGVEAETPVAWDDADWFAAADAQAGGLDREGHGGPPHDAWHADGSPVDFALPPELRRWSARLRIYLTAAGSLYALFFIELATFCALRAPRWRSCLWHCAFPPLRLGGRDHHDGKSIWLPMLGWRHVNRTLRREVERAFSGPMIVVALMMLPLLAIDLYWLEKIRRNPEAYAWLDPRYLRFAVAAGTVVIWMAFAIEFLVMASIVDKKFRYLKEHWLDVAIICLPMISFARLLRASQLLRMQQLVRVTRMYRLRGVGMRLLRGLLALDLLGRLLRISPERRIRALEERIVEKQWELDDLRAQVVELRRQVQAKSSARHGPGRASAPAEAAAEPSSTTPTPRAAEGTQPPA